MAVAWVGPLSRWYARTGGDLAKLRAGVEAWRADLRSSVAPRVAAQLEWDEGAPVAQEFDLGETGWAALRLFALYAEQPELELPDTVPVPLELDRQWRAAAAGGFPRSVYAQLLACSVWLPGEFPVTVKAPLPDGESAELGSVAVLADQLKWLNARTFAAEPSEVERWAELPAGAGGGLLDAARRGFAALAAAVHVAVAGRVPMLVG